MPSHRPATQRVSLRAAVSLLAAALAVAGCGASAAATKAPSQTSTPAVTAVPAVLTVYFENNAQVELVAPSGRRVLVDVWNAAALSKPPTADDVLLISHEHSDHYDASFAGSFPGKKLVNATGRLETADVRVTSIAASHDDAPVLPDPDATNHILVIDFDGFRIAHLGSTGQARLTAEQLAAIGRPDIAIGALQNVGGADPSGRKALDVMDQLAPRLIIPTHANLEGVQLAGAEWKGTFSTKPSVTISRAALPATTTVLYMGTLAPDYGKILKLDESGW